MPELPEVEAARRAIEEHCVGKRIAECTVADDSKVIDGVSPSDLESALIGKIVVAARRKGKNLWLCLDSPPFPTFQFGMAGAIYIKGVAVTKYKRSAVSDTDEWPSKYSKVFIKLADGLELSFTDKRRFARVRLFEDPEVVPPISELGSDALFEPMKVAEFVESLNKKNTSIKALLLDQSYISGIGNWLADEVLYQARIHPLQTASSLSEDSCKSLHRCIKEVVEYAVKVDADSNQFPIEWLFHFRWGKKSGEVNGKKIEFITAGGRTSAYVPELQKLSGKSSEKVTQKESRKMKSDKDADGSEKQQNEEEEYPVSSKSKKSGRTGQVSRKPQKGSDSDNDTAEPKEAAKGAKRKQGKVVATSSVKASEGTKTSSQKRARK